MELKVKVGSVVFVERKDDVFSLKSATMLLDEAGQRFGKVHALRILKEKHPDITVLDAIAEVKKMTLTALNAFPKCGYKVDSYGVEKAEPDASETEATADSESRKKGE